MGVKFRNGKVLFTATDKVSFGCGENCGTACSVSTDDIVLTIPSGWTGGGAWCMTAPGTYVDDCGDTAGEWTLTWGQGISFEYYETQEFGSCSSVDCYWGHMEEGLCWGEVILGGYTEVSLGICLQVRAAAAPNDATHHIFCARFVFSPILNNQTRAPRFESADIANNGDCWGGATELQLDLVSAGTERCQNPPSYVMITKP